MDLANQGNFLEFLLFFANHNEKINNVLKNAPENHKLTLPRIQKEIDSAIASETTNAIIREMIQTKRQQQYSLVVLLMKLPLVFTCCDNKCRESIFNHESYEDLATQSTWR